MICTHLSQLVDIYLGQESWHDKKLSRDEAETYFETVARKERLIVIFDASGMVLGYVESWRLSYEQFGRILCGESFGVCNEDIEHGPICYVANTYILPEFRNGVVQKELKTDFLIQNRDAEYFVGEARRKKHAPLKVFKRQEFLKEVMR